MGKNVAEIEINLKVLEELNNSQEFQKIALLNYLSELTDEKEKIYQEVLIVCVKKSSLFSKPQISDTIIRNKIYPLLVNPNHLEGQLFALKQLVNIPIELIEEEVLSDLKKSVVRIDISENKDSEFEDALDYINAKTEKLLNFGTELVVVLTKQEKLIIACPKKAWQFVKWNRDVTILENLTLNLAELMKEDEALDG